MIIKDELVKECMDRVETCIRSRRYKNESMGWIYQFFMSAWVAEYALHGETNAMNLLCHIEEESMDEDDLRRLDSASFDNPYLIAQSLLKLMYDRVHCVVCKKEGECPSLTKIIMNLINGSKNEELSNNEICPVCGRCDRCHNKTSDELSPIFLANPSSMLLVDTIRKFAGPDLDS